MHPPFGNDVRIFDFGGPQLGIETLDLESDDLASYFGVKAGDGVLVTGLLPDSGAEEAGIKAGDVILKLEQEEVGTTEALREALSEFEAGHEVHVTLLRDKKQQELTVELTQGNSTQLLSRYGIVAPRVPRSFGRGLNDDMGDVRQELRQLRRELGEMQREIRRKR